MTTPENVMNPAAPVTAPALPWGLSRASSDNCTPFQPMAVAPKTAVTGSTSHAGHEGVANAIARPHRPASNPMTVSVRRGARTLSATAPQSYTTNDTANSSESKR